MAANEIHVGDIGTVFEVTLMDGSSVVDLSSATTKELVFRKPDGVKLTKTAAFKTDGTDGIITYTSVTDDLDTAGTWRLQAHVVIGGGTWRSDIGDFKVHENL